MNLFGCIKTRLDARVPRGRIALVSAGRVVAVSVGLPEHDLARRRMQELGEEAARAASAEERGQLLYGAWASRIHA